MSEPVFEPIQRHTLLALLDGDGELLELMYQSELVPRDEQALCAEHAEAARVVCTLVHELEVNWPGVEVILRMRAELLAARRQMAELLALLRERREQ